ncbi:MAG: DUF262 domain-containing protein [Flavobacteriales bacterium]|nr:DUF262 domain-containing protein [Flavobacteriales bacterium]
MNKAADNIDAKSKSLKDILFERHYTVGYFQREYKWQRTHIEDLLIDLERSFNSNLEENHTQQDVANYNKYYMGPIVLYTENSEFSIVDGQQRLTSFILLMIYLNKKYDELLDIKNKYNGYIFSEHYGKESYNMNIIERDIILNFLHKGSEFDENVLKNESCKTLLERYNDIIELFPESLTNKKIFPLFCNWLTEKLVFIEILTQTSESAYTIFETMNDRGLNLTQTELLKSFLLSNVSDEARIKELDGIWKNKVSVLNAIDDDQDFFKAWLRAKYAITIRTTEKDSENKDFEKIGTRYSSWTQENTKFKDSGDSKLLLDIKDSDSFYYFVKSDFSFFCDIYIKLINFEIDNELPEHKFKLINYKGVSASLSYPLILAPLLKTDDEETINNKIDTVINYLDAFGIYRMILFEPITHSSIRNSIYLKIKEIRNLDLEDLIVKLKNEIAEYRLRFIKEDYIRFDMNSKYILSRLFKNKYSDIEFENIYFQRKKDSFMIYQYLKFDDFETEKNGLQKGLKERLLSSLCSFTLIPKSKLVEFDSLTFEKRLQHLIKSGYILEFENIDDLPLNNLKNFFISREKKLKESISNLLKV